MPLLQASDELPKGVRRVVVAGTAGSGKSTLARAVAERLAIRYIELDSLYHGPGWTVRAEFMADVEAFTSTTSWVTEWQYGAARNLLAERADTLVWLDYPKWLVMWRVTLRTIRRRLLRTRLWQGNLEPPLGTVFTDPEHIIRWAWSTHEKTRSRVLSLTQERPDLTVIRLRRPADANTLLQTLSSVDSLSAALPPVVSNDDGQSGWSG